MIWLTAGHALGSRLNALSPLLAELKLPAWNAPVFLVGTAIAAALVAALLAGTSGSRPVR